MHLPTPQAVNSTTFTPGPLDGSLSVPQLLDLQYAQSPDHPVYVYDTEDGGIHTICYRQYVPVVHQAARLVIRHLEELSLSQASSNVIGILALCDSISYCMMVNAITRAGHIPFVISHRNSVKGLAHLLRVTKTTYVYASPDSPMQALLSCANELLKAENGKALELLPMPSFEQVQGNVNVVVSLLPEMQRPDDKAIAVILHSSGSTSEISKHIPLPHKAYLQWARAAYFGERDLCGEVMSCHSIPIFHGMGICLTGWPAGGGLVVAFLRPTTPPTPPTPAACLASAIATKCTSVFCVPTFIEFWSEIREGMDLLKSMKVVSYGGATLNRRVGDQLIEEGVVLTQVYGAIENGVLTPFLPLKSRGKDWEYFVFSKHCKPVFVPRNDIGSDIYGLTIVEVPTHTPCFINTEVEGEPGFLMSDLLERHPENPDLWRLYGRLDDQIALSNSLKINPAPAESVITKHPDIDYAIIFGKGHTHPGLLVQLRKDLTFEPNSLSEMELASLRDRIWPAVKEVNESWQSHARIIKEMVIFASPHKPFDLTGKMQPRRPVILNDYETEIKAAYAAVEMLSLARASI